MEDKHIRLTLEFDIDSSVLQNNNLTVENILKNMVITNADSENGFIICANVPEVTLDSAPLFRYGTVTSKELIPARSMGDGLDTWRDMVRQEIDLNDDYYGLSKDEADALQVNAEVVDTLVRHIENYMVNYDVNAYQALDLVFRDEFPEILEEFREQQGKVSLDEQIASAESKIGIPSSETPFMANTPIR